MVIETVSLFYVVPGNRYKVGVFVISKKYSLILKETNINQKGVVDPLTPARRKQNFREFKWLS